MKKLPKIYQNPLEKKVNNNKMVFDSLKESGELENKQETRMDQETKNFDELSVYEKIQELVNQNSYIFNTKVCLVFFDREEVCQIAGVVNSHIITMDNKIIKIKELKDIKILK